MPQQFEEKGSMIGVEEKSDFEFFGILLSNRQEYK